jgi:signal peptidase I
MISANSSTELAARPRGVRLDAMAQATLRLAWFTGVPILLASAVLEFLVPGVSFHAGGPLGFVIALGQGYPLLVGLALFWVFSALARYWRFHLPGGRYLSPLPARLARGMGLDRDGVRDEAAAGALVASLTNGWVRRRADRTLPAPARDAIARHLAALESGLEEREPEVVREATRALESIAAPVLAAHRRRDALLLGAAVLAAAASAALLRGHVVSSYSVLSASMLPTLAPGDLIGGNRVAYAPLFGGAATAPRRGDVVVFRSAAVPISGAHGEVPDVLVKRVVGLPGDRVEMRKGLVAINGWEVPTCPVGEYVYLLPDGQGGSVHGMMRVEFLEDRAYLVIPTVVSDGFEGPYVVQPGEVFVLGDNRANSLDSRAWNRGRGAGVPVAAIDARVAWFLLGTHIDGRVDWGRALRSVDALSSRVDMEAADTHALEEGVARCLEDRPKDTYPPPPSGSLRVVGGQLGGPP